MPGRIASFFGDELVVGGFYHFISLLDEVNELKKRLN